MTTLRIMQPPLLPSEVLRRVCRLARFDGMSILVFAGGFAVISAASHEAPSAMVGLAVAGAGALELHGLGLLNHYDSRGTRWLVASQAYLMVVMVSYAMFRLMHPDIAELRPVVTEELAAQIREVGLTIDQFLLEFVRVVYAGVAAASMLYQGGMMLYYLRRRKAIEAAMFEDA